MTTITQLPTPPSKNDPENFADRADAFLAALQGFTTQTNAVASEITTVGITATAAAAQATAQAAIAIAQANISTAAAAQATAQAVASAAGAITSQNWATYAINTQIPSTGGEYSAKHYANIITSAGSNLIFQGIYTGSVVPAGNTIGWFYKISAPCTINSVTYGYEDIIVCTATTPVWQRIPSSVGLTSINNNTVPASFTSLTVSGATSLAGTLSGVGVSNYLLAPPPIGNNTPNTAVFKSIQIYNPNTFPTLSMGDYATNTNFIGYTANNGSTFAFLTGAGQQIAQIDVYPSGTNTGVYSLSTWVSGVQSERLAINSLGNTEITGSLKINGTGKRFTADFSNAAEANRLWFQPSGTGGMYLHMAPTDAASGSAIYLHGGNDVANYERIRIGKSYNGDAYISVDAGGSGVYRGLSFNTSGSTWLNIDADGTCTFNGSIINMTGNLEVGRLKSLNGLVHLGNATNMISNGTGIVFPANQSLSADLNTLDDYDEFISPDTPCQMALSTSIIWKITKIGNLVTMAIPSISGIASAFPAFSVGYILPSKYRPTIPTIVYVIKVKENGVSFLSTLVVGAAGLVYVNRNINGVGDFTAGVSIGIDATTISWIV